MFWPDILDLNQFYNSRLGKAAHSIIIKAIERIWPSTKGEMLLGIGYTPPYLNSFRKRADRVLALMPAGQGAIHWPVGEMNLTFLADEADIPLPDASISRILLIHAIENTEQLRPMLREIWRVLAPNGKILAVVPNRSGLWARVATSPFAHGSPFSAYQLRNVLREHGFACGEAEHALFLAPSGKRYLLNFAPLLEWFGRRFCPAFSGVILMEGEKQLFAPSKQTVAAKKREAVYSGAAAPAMIRKGNCPSS